ncbi:menaquinol-cytochrome c reductase cytochrome b subunit precursor [Halogeometricum borinquense DSM 11551]|uniref:Menaquinol-cytochrome c reductase cytochrome b subunit n=1 Tax=Halogeometricum borinquense (strain ATCC 700274 / DSM 11551 / JCM 10706 / KCTC 4070 / PR3) TaxID=469382 RepID=E4NV33_HALBP|nr:cytochrome bc complex cytochrome b subunit [Halogeometricum borinquense]ADQ69022.1 menaquinol-cytochrome c reductase cytochrome b subunit precursor [Halogeometricum borinquense DSM 11551]ELY29476.1 menaquinol-cytochrome c reductase cytochrome b subunit precursor [Halogeometricum borinquense DSM 11551]
MSRVDRLEERASDAGTRTYNWLDSRFDLDNGRAFLGKAFPAEDSFLLGEVALFCFVMLALTGMFLGMFFEPSTSAVEYEGSVAAFQGEEVPEAFASVLHITYDIPFGMFIRRIHHWAAHLFVASIGLHMLRVFFTGAYRNPREPNWVVGTGLAGLAMGAAYTGYALPFDEFAATATGIGYNLATSIPFVGSVVGKVVFGGEFPSSATIPRLYFFHVLVIPVAIAILLAIHMAILVRQKHTEAPRNDDVRGAEPPQSTRTPDAGAVSDGGTETAVAKEDDTVVVGLPAFPNQAAVSAVVFFLTLATLAALGGFFPVHNIAEYGPNNPAGTPELIMPDWFLMWVYGFLKLLPSWMSFTIPVVGVHVSTEFVGGVLLPTVVFGAIAVWPFIDYRENPVHFTASPLDRPWQTAVGVAAIQFIMIASIAGMNNLLGRALDVGTEVVNPILTVALFVVPGVSGLLTYRLLQDDSTEGDDR